MVASDTVGDTELLKLPRRVKTLHKRILVALGCKVAARLEAQYRNNHPTQR